MAWPINKLLGPFRRWLLGDVPTPDRGSMSIGWGLGLADDGQNDRAILSNAAPVYVPILHGGGSSTATSSSGDAIVTTFYFQTSEWREGASEVRLYALCGLAGSGPTTWHVEIYDQTNDASVVIANRSDAQGVPVELDIDLTADLLSADRALYSLRLFSASGAAVSATQTYLKIT